MYEHERSLVLEMKGSPFALIGVNSDKSPEVAKEAIAKNKLNWRSFQDQPKGSDAKISGDWFINGWPTIVVLDAERKVHYRGHDGKQATEVAKALVETLKASAR